MRIAAVLLVALVVAGCGSVPREAGFDDVQQTVNDRTGMRIHWNQGSEADAAVASEVRSMLGRGELSADEAVQIALLNNRRLQATYEDLMVAQADLVAAGLLSNPIFEAEITFAEGGGGTGLEFTVVQEFLSLFQIPLRKRIAGARFEAAKLRVSGAVIDLAADVRDAHAQYVAALQVLEMRQTVAEASEASAELSRRLRAAGNITPRAHSLELAQHEQATLALAASEFEVLARREQLSVLMGLSGADAEAWQAPGRLPEVSSEPSEDEVAATATELEDRAVEQSLELAAIRQEVAGSQSLRTLQRTYGLLPELEVGAKAEREHGGDWAAGPVFELPIPLFSQGQPEIAAAAAELRRAQARYQATEVELRSAVRAAQALVENARQRVRQYEESVLPLHAAIVEQTQLEYNAMVASVFELLQARQQQVEAGRQYIEALRDYWLARNALDTLLAGRMRQASPSANVGTSEPTGGATERH